MLIHLSPRLRTCEVSGPNCELVDLQIPELGLTLRGGHELVTRRPYPNKTYLVACRKEGKKAIDGILIESPHPLWAFSAISRWAVDAERIVQHRVNYTVLDDDFDAISDKMVLWHASGEGGSKWRSRYPDLPAGSTPANTQPCMSVSPELDRKGDLQDRLVKGIIVERTETFRLHTIERARLLPEHCEWDRLPLPSSAFRAESLG